MTLRVLALTCLLIVMSGAQISRDRRTLSAAPCLPAPARVTALAAGDHDALLVGTGDGLLYRRAVAAACFTQLAVPPLQGAIGLLVSLRHPNWIIAANAMLAVSGSLALGNKEHGLYRSEDGGATWHDATVGLGTGPILATQMASATGGTLVLGFVCPVYSPTVLAPPCAGGIARSSDGGRSWQGTAPRGLEARGVVSTGAHQFAAVMTAIAGSGAQGWVYRSNDDGRTWQYVSELPRNANDFASLFVLPWNPTVMLLGFGRVLLKPVVVRSTDGGRHWSRLKRELLSNAFGMAASFAGDARHRTVLVTSYHSIYRSPDDGANWTDSGRGLPSRQNPLAIDTLLSVTGTGTMYAGNVAPGAGLFRSDDGGLTWTAIR